MARLDPRTREPERARFTGALAEPAFAALEVLLRAREAAAEPADPDHLLADLLPVLLRLVFLLLAEDRGLLPGTHQHASVRALFDRLDADARVDADAMARRFDAWPRLLATEVLASPHGPDLAAAAPLDDRTVHAALARLRFVDGRPVAYHALDIEQLGSVYEALLGHQVDRLPSGRLVLAQGRERRRTGAHYTPRALAESVVHTTLAPLIAAMGPAPASAALLELRICDPAMGSGAFLMAVVRVLADHLVAAWTREGAPHGADADLATHARRQIALRCIRGVDRNPLAVQLARLSLWLTVGARDLPFTCLDHALRCGDSLVGLSVDQLACLHWDACAPPDPLVAAELRRALDAAAALRDAPACERASLLRERDALLDRLRLIADLVVGAFFAGSRAKDRELERRRRVDLISAWLRSDAPPPPALEQLRVQLRRAQAPFHWPLEFPELFTAGAAGLGAFVGNPPFAGKNNILAAGGPHYVEWLQAIHPGAHGNADLAAHFLRRADALLGPRGTLGVIATNTIGQGDTRATGLQHLVTARGFTIYAATRHMPWPEAAAVTISIVHLARGVQRLPDPVLRAPDPDLPGVLVTRAAPAIDSRLRPAPERPDPVPLRSNAGLSFIGVYVLGRGFVLTPAERDALVRKDPRNAERIAPYLGGEEVNTDPGQGHDRHVIDFGQMELAEAARWPDLLARVEARVKPERDRNNRTIYRERWWQFGEPRPGLRAALRPLTRCLVTARVTKHLCFSFQPTDRVLHEKLVVLPVDHHTAFAVLQSRLHAAWAWLLSSTMKTDLNYAPSDCFDPFPFPRPSPTATIPALEALGQRLHAERAAHMHAAGQGLTRTYNALKDPACSDPAVLALRVLHLELDRAVLAAYGWSDIAVPPYTTPRSPAERRPREAFEDAVLARLFALNAARAAEEAARPR